MFGISDEIREVAYTKGYQDGLKKAKEDESIRRCCNCKHLVVSGNCGQIYDCSQDFVSSIVCQTVACDAEEIKLFGCNHWEAK